MASVALSSAAGAEPFAGWNPLLTRTRRGTAVMVVVVGCVDWACSAVIPNSPRNTSTGAGVRVRIRYSFVQHYHESSACGRLQSQGTGYRPAVTVVAALFANNA